MIIVELIGLSGCGKSTLCKKIQTELKKRGIKTASLQKTYGYNSFYGKVMHYLKLKMASKAVKNQQFKTNILNAFTKTDVQKCRGYLYWYEKMLMLNHAWLKAEGKGVKVGLIDEGCIQFISSILEKREADDKLIPVIEELCKEMYGTRTIFVNCELEPEKCYERMCSRGRFAGGDDDDSLELTVRNLSIRRHNLDFIISKLNNGQVVSVKMEGDDGLESILETIYNKMNNCSLS